MFDTHNKKTIRVPFLVLGIAVLCLALGLLYMWLGKQRVRQIDTPPAKSANEKIYTQDNLADFFNDIVKSDNIEIKEELAGNMEGCKMLFNYAGQISGVDQYAVNEGRYADVLAEKICKEKDIMENYTETYWVKDKIYNRQYKNQNFIKLAESSKEIKSEKPADYLARLFSDPQSFNIISQNDSGSGVNVNTSVRNKQMYGTDFSGEFIFSIEKEDNTIGSVRYNITDSNNNSLAGDVYFTSFQKPIEPPIVSSNSFLLSSFDDIRNFPEAYYEVNAENYLFYNERNYANIHVLLTNSGQNTSKDCYLSESTCQNKLNELKGYMNQLQEYINNAKPDACENEEPITGLHSEIYKNRLMVGISNAGRNPKETSDYSFKIVFVTAGANANSYRIRLKFGKEYCYYGETTSVLLDRLSEKFSGFVNNL